MFARPLLTAPLLAEYGARCHTLPAKHLLYEEGQPPRCYYQLESGMLREFNYGEESDFVQKIYFAKESMGDAALFGGFPYPASGETILDCTVWELPKATFLRVLREHPEVAADLTRRLCQYVRFQALQRRNSKLLSAEDQLMSLLRYLAAADRTRLTPDYLVPFTRQQLADMLGLRVETVIRLVRKLEQSRHLQIIDHKIRVSTTQAHNCCDGGFLLAPPPDTAFSGRA